MKGYYVNNGYMGYVPSLGTYLLFTTETDYIETVWNDEKEE